METRAHYIAVGGFVLTVIAIAFAAVLWIGRTEFSTQYAKYDIYFSGTVSGLSVGSPVLYNGIRVGQVTDIRIDPENVEQIRVQAEIEGKVIIKSDAVAGLETNLLSGVSTIQITGGTQNAPVLVAEAGHPYPVIQSRRSRLDRLYARAPRLLERLIELTENANQVLDEKNRKAFAEMLDNLKITSAALAEGSKDIPPITQDTRELIGTAKVAVGDVKSAIDTAKSALNTADKFIQEVEQSYVAKDGLKDQLSTTLGDFDKLARGLGDTNQRLQATLQDVRPGVREFSSRTVNQVTELMIETRQLVQGLSRLAAQIERDPTRVLFGDRREGYRPR